MGVGQEDERCSSELVYDWLTDVKRIQLLSVTVNNQSFSDITSFNNSFAFDTPCLLASGADSCEVSSSGSSTSTIAMTCLTISVLHKNEK